MFVLYDYCHNWHDSYICDVHHTVVICRQEQYEQINIEGVTTEQSKDFAAEVFSATSDYDLDVSNWFFENDMPLESTKLRYGENPHQEGFLSMIGNAPIDFHDPIQGKEISYNNVSDALAAWACVNEFSDAWPFSSSDFSFSVSQAISK